MAPRLPDMTMLGSTGADVEREDLLPQLRGERWHRTVREMTDGDPVIAAILFAVEMMVRRVDWRISPASKDPEDEAVATFVDECLFQDLAPDWEDTLAEIISFLPYGWSVLEVVYKRRAGETEDPATTSRFTDGRIGWRSWSIRPQDTLHDWVFQDDGTVEAMMQVATTRTSSRLVTIPMDKALLFRTTSRHGAPEGRSILRSAYAPWYYKREIQKIEAIGIERDLAGLPVVFVPPKLLSASASAEDRQALDMFKRIATNIRRNEQEGVVFPLSYKDGKPEYDIKLLASGGQRQFDTNVVIQRYDTRIAMSILADFIMLGHAQVGTFALASTKTDLFMTAMETWLDEIASVVNTQAIRPLLRYNGIPTERAPRLTHGKVHEENLDQLGTYLTSLANAGVLDVSPELQQHVLTVAGLPVPKEAGE